MELDGSFEASPLLGLSQRLPPHNSEAEQSLLGALLANNRAYDRVSAYLKPEHFAHPINGRIFQAIVRRVESGHLADAVTLKAEFEHSGILDEVGGTAYLAQLLASMVGVMNAHEYGRTIHETWLRRQLIDIGETVVNNAFGADPELDGQAQIDVALHGLADLNEETIKGATPDFAASAMRVVERAEAAHQGLTGAGRLDTGVASIDALWQGLWPGRLYYLMARSRTGKTPALMQFARHMARGLLADGAGEHIHIFSLEMSAEDLQTVNLVGETRWTGDQLRRGEVDDWYELERAAKNLGTLPIIIDDQRTDFPGLAARARAVHRRKKVRLIAVDYMDLVRRGDKQRGMGLPEWVPLLGYEFKDLSKELNVPIVVLRQINKSRDKADTTRPTLHDLPYDGGQAADEVAALYRPEIDMGLDPPGFMMLRTEEERAQSRYQWETKKLEMQGRAEFHALKRRFGPTGFATLRFDGPRMTLRELEI